MLLINLLFILVLYIYGLSFVEKKICNAEVQVSGNEIKKISSLQEFLAQQHN